jgi:hypothetical protein
MNATSKGRFSWMAATGLGVLVAAVFLIHEFAFNRPTTINCSDGPRRTIDIRQFATTHSRYAIQLEADVTGRGKFLANLKPEQGQSLTEAAQQANEFRKYLVAGYNGCAISAAQFGDFEVRFNALDGLARQIDGLVAKSDLTALDQSALSELVSRYAKATQDLTTRP